MLTCSLIVLGCEQSFQKNKNSYIKATVNIKDTSNQYIYNFMKVVIADQKLNLNYGLTIEPEQGCDLSGDDETFLKTLLFENSKKDKELAVDAKIIYSSPPKILTQADIDDMMLQKKKLINFVWDNSRLGFNISNKKNWYCFSRPLFSSDGKKAVMLIRDLCSGLCGSGWTVIFINNNEKWVSQSSFSWLH